MKANIWCYYQSSFAKFHSSLILCNVSMLYIFMRSVCIILRFPYVVWVVRVCQPSVTKAWEQGIPCPKAVRDKGRHGAGSTKHVCPWGLLPRNDWKNVPVDIYSHVSSILISSEGRIVHDGAENPKRESFWSFYFFVLKARTRLTTKNTRSSVWRW